MRFVQLLLQSLGHVAVDVLNIDLRVWLELLGLRHRLIYLLLLLVLHLGSPCRHSTSDFEMRYFLTLSIGSFAFHAATSSSLLYFVGSSAVVCMLIL